jgi:hypothetical protein
LVGNPAGEIFKDSEFKVHRLSRLMLCANIERAHRRTRKTTPMTERARSTASELLDLLN